MIRLPRLSGPRVGLLPVPYDVAVAAVAGDRTGTGDTLAGLGLRAGAGWPHPDTADALRPLAEHGTDGDDGGWLVVVDADDLGGEQRGTVVVGEVGWKGGPDPDGEVEIGYGLAAPACGRGLATEAVGVLAAWAEQQPGVRVLAAQVHPGNEPSLRLLVRLGFTVRPGSPTSPYVCLVRRAPAAVPVRTTGRHVC